MSTVTLGEVIREMVGRALKAEDKKFSVPVRHIFKAVKGKDYDELEFDADTGECTNIKTREFPELRNSYIYNTVSRIEELRSLDLRARYSFDWLDQDGEKARPGKWDGDEVDKYLTIKLEKGAKQPSEKRRADKAREELIINNFKDRLLKLSPSVAGMNGEELKGAVAMINAYQEMIKETK